jgi:hypothetical protein
VRNFNVKAIRVLMSAYKPEIINWSLFVTENTKTWVYVDQSSISKDICCRSIPSNEDIVWPPSAKYKIGPKAQMAA